MLKVKNLIAYKGAKTLVGDISLEVKRGEIACLIGPNDSGKSALLQTIAGGQPQFDGDVRINSYSLKQDPEKAKLHTGYLADPATLEEYLTGLEWLEFMASVYNLSPKARIPRILELAEKLNCKDELYTTINRVGAATKQKIGLIAALLHKPSVVLLDEPTLHLDYDGQQQVEKLITEQVAEGAAIIIATNDLHLAQTLHDRLVIIQNGTVLADGSLTELHHQFRSENRDLLSVYNKIFHE